MHFVHNNYQPGDTISAIATPPGEGGVAIIRISGTSALTIADTIFSGSVHSYSSHTAHYGSIIDQDGCNVDHVLLLVFLGKRSYTGEDTAEIHCHGGTAVVQRVLEVTFAAGARPALPGEFTCRAFLNGKIDLAQAEAVQALIGAKNEHAMDAARTHLEGKLSKHISTLQHSLTHIAAILEAWVDFPDEGLEFASLEELIEQLTTQAQAMEKLLSTFHEGRMLAEGVAMCLVGCPNVGKSSLMNALLDKERAIVSPVAGTTRDTIEDNLRINGLQARLIDTAGIRITAEAIEQEGIRRSRAALATADLVLFVLDATQGITADDEMLLQEVSNHNTIAIWNKTDLAIATPPQLSLEHVVSISALQRTGIDQLKAAIDSILWQHGAPQRDEVLISNLRQKKSLEQALEACRRVIHALNEGLSPEFAALDMRACLLALGTIIGTDITEDVLSAIFSTFCVGK
jgi:tRNA modification GTPase